LLLENTDNIFGICITKILVIFDNLSFTW